MAKARTMKVDFSGVDPEIRKGGKAKHIPEGDYKAKVVSAEVLEGPKANYISWRCQVVEGPEKGATVYGNTTLSPKGLWNLRNLIFSALGKNVAGKAVNFSPETLYGKVVGISVEDNEYEKDGKTRISSSIAAFFPASELAAPGDEEEEGEEEVEEEEEDEDLEDVDVEEI